MRYSSEHIFFYQSQVVIELVAHFSWTWFCFFPKDRNPKQIIGYFSYDSQIILAFSCRRSVLSEKVVQYMVQTIFYFPVISFDFHTISGICGRNPFLPDNQLRDKSESLHDHVLSSFHISDLSPCACNRPVPLRLYLCSNDTEIFFNSFICSSVISETKTWFSM